AFDKGVQSNQNLLGCHLVAIAKHRAEVCQQTDTKALVPIVRYRYQSDRRYTRALWPVTADNVSDADQGLPDVGISILNLGWQLRPLNILGQLPCLGPDLNLLADLASLLLVNALAKGFDLLAGMAPSHANDDRARHDRIGQPAEARDRNRGI